MIGEEQKKRKEKTEAPASNLKCAGLRRTPFCGSRHDLYLDRITYPVPRRRKDPLGPFSGYREQK